MAAERQFTLLEASALFKIKYEKLSENVYNSANVLLGRCKKSYKFVGKQMQITIPQSFAGGVGSGELPKSNTAIYSEAIITAKKVYATVEIDRETIKAAMADEGSFVRATKEVVKKGVESYMRNMSRILFNDGSGQVADLSSATGIPGTSIVVPAADFKEADLEERDLLDVIENTTATGAKAKVASQNELQEVSINASTGDATLTFASSIAAATGGTTLRLAMQNSSEIGASTAALVQKDPQGIKGVLDATSGSKYNIEVKRRWKSVQKDASSASVSTDLLNEVMLKVEKNCGKSPNLIVTSYKQYEKILNLLEDQKQYTINTRAGLKSKSGADISFSGVEFMSSAGPIGIFPERFVEDDRVYFLNDNHIHIYHRPDFGWFDDDGTVFLRKATEDAYEARYGGYLECYINPCFHGVLSNLA